jgi:hypothetical protein
VYHTVELFDELVGREEGSPEAEVPDLNEKLPQGCFFVSG